MMKIGAVRRSEEEQSCRRISKCRVVKAHVSLAYPDNRVAVSGPDAVAASKYLTGILNVFVPEDM